MLVGMRSYMEIQEIITELKKEIEGIDRAIAALSGTGLSILATKGRRPGRPPASSKIQVAPTGKKTGRALTAEGRRRLSESMKKRWAERRKKA
jgi:hypothetical protein